METLQKYNRMCQPGKICKCSRINQAHILCMICNVPGVPKKFFFNLYCYKCYKNYHVLKVIQANMAITALANLFREIIELFESCVENTH